MFDDDSRLNDVEKHQRRQSILLSAQAQGIEVGHRSDVPDQAAPAKSTGRTTCQRSGRLPTVI
jgi:hypothetical protein